MLGVGGVAAISGIAWLLASYLDEASGRADGGGASVATRRDLHRLTTVMVHGMTVTVSLLLVSATLDYLDKVLVHGTKGWMTMAAYAVPLAVAGTAITMAFLRARRLRGATAPQAASEKAAATSTTASAIGILIYALTGPITAGGIFVNLPPSVWSPTPTWLILIGVLLGLGFPGALLVMLALAAPPLKYPGVSLEIFSHPARRSDESKRSHGSKEAAVEPKKSPIKDVPKTHESES